MTGRHLGGVLGCCGGLVGLHLGEHGLALVLDVGHVAGVVVRGVSHGLHPAIGQLDSVAAGDNLQMIFS